MPDVVSNAPNGKASVSQPSVSGQGSSGSFEGGDLKSTQGNLDSELSDPNSKVVPNQECPKFSIVEPAAAAAAEAHRSNHHGATDPAPHEDKDDVTSINQDLSLSNAAGEPPNSNSEASVVGATGSQSPHNQVLDLSHPVHSDEGVPPIPNSEASSDQDFVSGHELHHNQEIDAAGGITKALNLNHGLTVPATATTAAAADATTTSATTTTAAAAASTTTPTVAAAANAEETTRVVGSNSVAHDRQEAIVPTATVPPFQSLTGTPVQEEAENTVGEGTAVDETTQQEETATSYDHCFGK